MLTDEEIEEYIAILLDLRKKLLWLVSRNPINDKQREYIEKGKENLEKITEMLESFGARLPS